MTVYVVGSHQGFSRFCDDRGLNPQRRPREVVHITSPEDTRGRTLAADDEVVYLLGARPETALAASQWERISAARRAMDEEQ